MEEKLIVSKLEGSRIDKLFRNYRRGETPDSSTGNPYDPIDIQAPRL
jgi:hypothetical protein